jgi:DNA mismatch endonuclease, patch repair protein
MADVHSKAVRSYNMSRIRSKDTKPEMLVRRFLFSKGYRYKLHDRSLPGKPDIVLPKYKVVIFVHGCFWHGHVGCRYYVVPKSRTEWWLTKINKNKQLDLRNSLSLAQANWKVLSIFECQLKKEVIETTFRNLLKELR